METGSWTDLNFSLRIEVFSFCPVMYSVQGNFELNGGENFFECECKHNQALNFFFRIDEQHGNGRRKVRVLPAQSAEAAHGRQGHVLHVQLRAAGEQAASPVPGQPLPGHGLHYGSHLPPLVSYCFHALFCIRHETKRWILHWQLRRLLFGDART